MCSGTKVRKRQDAKKRKKRKKRKKSRFDLFYFLNYQMN